MIWLICLIAGLLVAHAVRARLRLTQLEKLQDELIAKQIANGSGYWYRVNVSSPRYHHKLVKPTPFETKGVLVSSQDKVQLFLGTPIYDASVFAYYASSARPARRRSERDTWISVGKGSEALKVSAGPETLTMLRNLAPDRMPAREEAGEFALESNRASLLSCIAVIAVPTLALADAFIFNDYKIISFGNVFWLVYLLPVIAFFFTRWLRHEQVPANESAGLTLMMVIAGLIAFAPLLMRADQWLSDGPTPYEYLVGDQFNAQPADEGPPGLSAREFASAGGQLKRGARYTIRLVHGPLGLWQLAPATLSVDTGLASK